MKIATTGTAAVFVIRVESTASAASAEGDALLQDGYWIAPHLEAELKTLRDPKRDTLRFESDPRVPFMLIKKLLFIAGKNGFLQPEFSLVGPDAFVGRVHRYGTRGSSPQELPFYLDRLSLDPAQIDATIKKHLAAIQLCYERELPGKPHLGGKLIVHFVIETTGTVSSASMKSTTMHDDIVERCVAAVFTAMKFGTSPGGGIATVNYPLLFQASTHE